MHLIWWWESWFTLIIILLFYIIIVLYIIIIIIIILLFYIIILLYIIIVCIDVWVNWSNWIWRCFSNSKGPSQNAMSFHHPVYLLMDSVWICNELESNYFSINNLVIPMKRKWREYSLMQGFLTLWCFSDDPTLTYMRKVGLDRKWLMIDSRVSIISLHARWPIRTTPPTCTNQDTRVLIASKRSNVNSTYTAPWHNWPRPLPRKVYSEGCIFLNTFFHFTYLALAIVPFRFGGIQTWLGFCL